MADRPIIFSAPMVRALLEVRKTQTRRLIKWQGPRGFPHSFDHARVDNPAGVPRLLVPYHHPEEPQDWGDCTMHRHYGQADPGDRLWVREACRAEELSQPPGERPATKAEREKLGRTKVPVMSELDGADGVRYLADDSWRIIENSPAASDRWIDLFHYRGRGEAGVGNPVPSIHMPRWASRLTLTVTDVRVQRLWAISEADAVAEGVSADRSIQNAHNHWVDIGGGDMITGWDAREVYSQLWDHLHDYGAWGKNPWVCALTFTVHRGNIDQMPGVA